MEDPNGPISDDVVELDLSVIEWRVVERRAVGGEEIRGPVAAAVIAGGSCRAAEAAFICRKEFAPEDVRGGGRRKMGHGGWGGER